jgi:hypothetical protein
MSFEWLKNVLSFLSGFKLEISNSKVEFNDNKGNTQVNNGNHVFQQQNFTYVTGERLHPIIENENKKALLARFEEPAGNQMILALNDPRKADNLLESNLDFIDKYFKKKFGLLSEEDEQKLVSIHERALNAISRFFNAKDKDQGKEDFLRVWADCYEQLKLLFKLN